LNLAYLKAFLRAIKRSDQMFVATE